MQRAGVVAAGERAVCVRGRGQRPLRIDLDERVDRAVDRLDPAQVRLDDLARGRLAGSDRLRQPAGGCTRELVHAADT